MKKTKILAVDFIYYILGHKRMNVELIKSLNLIAEVTVLAPQGFYKKEDLPTCVHIIEYIKLPDEKRYRDKFVNSIRIMRLAANLDNKNKFDYIWATTFLTDAFCVGQSFFCKKDRFYLMHQYNTDALCSGISSKLFALYKRKVHHVVAEQFFGDYLEKKFDIPSQRIHYVPHPAYCVKKDCIEYKYDCIALSNSNDENVIKKIIQIEKKEEFFKRNDKHVVIRSRFEQFDNGNLCVVNGFLSERDYERYLEETKIIYMPFPLTFQYRISGTLIEGISYAKYVVGTPIPLISDYEKRYPGICKGIASAEELVAFVCNSNDSYGYKAREEFMEEHSSGAVASKMEEAFHGID